MQVRIFTIPVSDAGNALQELNAFLAGHRVLEMEQQFYSGEHGACWNFCVRYLNSPNNAGGSAKVKIDYRQVLGEEEFIRFAKLREIRKEIAQHEAIPAYAVFTDEELAGIAQLTEITVGSMRRGVGGEVNVTRHEITLDLNSLGPLSPCPFLRKEKGVKMLYVLELLA